MFENIIFEGKKRYYVEDLSVKNLHLENTTPHKLEILGETIEQHSWVTMLTEMTKLLLEHNEKATEDLTSFRASWSKTSIFVLKNKTNHKPVADNLYLNCNHTAVHACWLIGELLDFFGVDRRSVRLIINRAPSAEPKEVREHFENEFKAGFKNYLLSKHAKTDDQINEIFDCIENKLNWLLHNHISKGYNNFYIFDSYTYVYMYATKAKKKIKERFNVADRTPLFEVLDLIMEYYKINKY